MRAARDVFPEVGCEERKLEVLQVLLLFDVIFLYNFFGYIPKTCQFCCKINKFRTFLLIYLHISNFFCTFAARIVVRACMYIYAYTRTRI